MKCISSAILLLFLTTVSLFFPPAPCSAVPVLTNKGKTAISAPRRNRSKSPVILGKYKDISQYKFRSSKAAMIHKNKKVKKLLSAKSAIIIDAKSGQTLFSLSPDIPRQPASTIKVITGMIALKSLSVNDTIPVSRRAAKQPRSKIYLDRRKNYKANDLINAVLLASANDASVALAEKIAGSEKSFARMMTVRARIWGAQRTVCKTATGLTARGQRSTARDLATIFRHIMQDNEFAKRIKQTKVRTSFGSTLRNHNKALWQVKGTIGGKTGYTRAAKQTYVGKFKRGEKEIIIALMASKKMWTDVKRLVHHGFYTLKHARAIAENSRVIPGVATTNQNIPKNQLYR